MSRMFRIKRKFIFFVFVSIFFHILIFAIPLKVQKNNLENQITSVLIASVEKSEKTKIKPQKKLNKTKEIKKDLINQNSVVEKVLVKKDIENIENDTDNQIDEYEIGDISGPKIQNSFKPVYPFKMKMKGIEGKVFLKLLIDKDGSLLKWEVIEKTNDEFLKSVLNEIERVKFIPATSNGFAIKSYGILRVYFKLD